jgi:plastocyanin domain-containing protein
MSIDKIIVLIISIIGILFTYWFFLKKEDHLVEVSGDEVDITVEGGYKPASVVIPFGKTTKLSFFRKDTSSCLEEVVLGDFKIRKFLPLNEKVTLEVTPQKKGEFGFSCGMNMFHGKLVVK